MPRICPHCEAKVPRGAKACPECGSDDRTGWASDEELDYQGVEIPDAYDPERWEREAEERAAKAPGRRLLGVAALLVAAPVAIALLERLARALFGR
jgi:hypothetical protein